MNCSVQKTEVDEHFDPLAHENGNSLQSCIYQKIEQVTLYKKLPDHNSAKFGRGFLLGDKICVSANFLWSY